MIRGLFLPHQLDGRDRESWHGHALVCGRSCVQYCPTSFTDPDLTPAQELDPVLEPIWAQGSLATTDSLDLVFPSDEVIIEALTGPDRPWDDLHHRSYFLPELRRIEAGEFVLTMTGDRSCPVSPLAMHAVYAEGNMESIIEMIPIDISSDGETTTPFIFNQIVARFDIPKEIVTDHGSHFQNKMMSELTSKLGLRQEHSSPYYPQANGQVEAVNKSLKTILQ
jgi:hypothetical protein